MLSYIAYPTNRMRTLHRAPNGPQVSTERGTAGGRNTFGLSDLGRVLALAVNSVAEAA